MMHDGQVELSTGDVTEIVGQQFPDWSDREVRCVESHGTVNALFRLGSDLVARFPLVVGESPGLEQFLRQEQAHARYLGGLVSLAVPEPVALGEPSARYPGYWSVFRWIPGESIDLDTDSDLMGHARVLARFVRSLHGLETDGRRWDGRSRGGPLSQRDDDVRVALAASVDLIDTTPLVIAWNRSLEAKPYEGSDVCIHGDLMPGNLIVRDDRLVAVIDCGPGSFGDPAVDLMPAWNLLDASSRRVFRASLGADDDMWERGRGWAMVQALVALPYYIDSNTVMAATAKRTLDALVNG
jgi:aminoglycoside phosphotransferase (APT) family kinase protein